MQGRLGPWLGIWVTPVFTPLRPNTAESEILAVSFLPFLKIKMEKSGLCTASGVHRLPETWLGDSSLSTETVPEGGAGGARR